MLAMAGTVVGCGANTDELVGSSALSISGTLKTTSTSLQAMRTDMDPLASLIGSPPYSNMAVSTLADLKVSCVTFSVPPVAAEGAVDSVGAFAVNFPDGTVGKNFGCFIYSNVDASLVIPMVFVDKTKKSLSGDDAQNSSLAVSGSIIIPEVALDLDRATAEVDVSTIQLKDGSATGTSALAVATGTRLDFTGEYTIKSPASLGISLPSAEYKGPCTFADMSGEDKCHGPIDGMRIYMLRAQGKNWVYNNKTACDAATKLQGADAASLLAGDCNGTTGSEDVYGVMLWTADVEKTLKSQEPTTEAEFKAIMEAAAGDTAFIACGRRIGFTTGEAKVFGGVDLTTDPKLDQAGGYSAAAFAFDTAPIDLGTAGAALVTDGVLANQIIELDRGWMVKQAKSKHQMHDCQPNQIDIGGKLVNTWRCKGTYDADGTATDVGPVNAYMDNFGRGCYYTNGGTPVMFDNWEDYNESTGRTWETITTINGVALPAGYHGGISTKENFTPKRWADPNNDGVNTLEPIGSAGTVACEHFNGAFYDGGTQIPADGNGWVNMGPDYWAPGALINIGDNCYTAATTGATPAAKLNGLRCLAQVYWEKVRELLPDGCTRDVRLDHGATDPNRFEINNGPEKAAGELSFEMFNYASSDSGSFTFTEEQTRGVETSDGSNKMWVSCRIRETTTITLTTINGNQNQLLADMTSVSSLADRFNKVCVAAETKGDLDTGTSKTMFVMDKR
ncbi:MAG: hypothetical protein A2X94_04025 [Bdellovibrionales bacterium GWB1_55_8]|nr:MAG: hypothetical protein A2X94_04025 [Bdellovibrionales bacterium GWB1_55_8]